MTMPSTPCKLLVALGLMVLVALGCGEQQEPTPPAKPVVAKKVVRKKIAAPKPPPVQAVKPGDQEPTGPVTAEKPPVELAKVEAEPATPEPEAEADKELSPEEIITKVAYIYDPKGKIDPFRSVFVAQQRGREGGRIRIDADDRRRNIPLTPLQKVAVSQLKVVGIIMAPTGNKALVQDPEGKGYVITKGTYVGSNFGQVKQILRDRIVVEEEVEDFFTGQMNLQTVDLMLQKKSGV
ncbi:MAG: pilus assembly protein PilP [Deltaproteobacteria bacterium]|nr:pilus assembly protein PilP [Deltaproteobacteria bacterium]